MKNQKQQKNYLDFVPIKNESIAWSSDNDGLITLEIQNKGVFNRIAQKLFKKPPITYIHLDENGSGFVKDLTKIKSLSRLPLTQGKKRTII